ncbi:MAG: FAD-dependent oxidoreductase [Phycisphaerales bacterium JB054]
MPIPLDCLILGGGIAGLWALRTLTDAGYDALLVETDALGHGQTIASQGILHAGTKYALTGDASRASKAAGEAAAVWRDCLSGTGPIDLRDTNVLSRHTCMFTTPGVGSRLAGLAASKALTSLPQKLDRAAYPDAFAGAPGGVNVYQLDEPVMDLPALLTTLAAPVRDRLLRAQAVQLRWDDERSSSAASMPRPERSVIAQLTTETGALSISPRALICTAGAGNEALLAQLDLAAELRMQRRPLHMVLARGKLPHLYAHCVGLSDKPRATITSAADAAGRTVWYIGGTLAETGVDRQPAEQIASARRELAEILPWISLDGVKFATLRVDRAEGFDESGRRPDTPVVRAHGSVIACWPTKLVLAPLAAAGVLEQLRRSGVSPTAPASDTVPTRRTLASAPRPEPAMPIWDRDSLSWS